MYIGFFSRVNGDCVVCLFVCMCIYLVTQSSFVLTCYALWKSYRQHLVIGVRGHPAVKLSCKSGSGALPMQYQMRPGRIRDRKLMGPTWVTQRAIEIVADQTREAVQSDLIQRENIMRKY